MTEHELVCIVCPVGCRLTIKKYEGSECGYEVVGNKCKRGLDYCIKELNNPTRVLTTTVRVMDGHLPRLPVRSKGEIKKNLLMECMKALCEVEVCVPISIGDVIVENLLETGIDIIATRSMT